MLVSKFRPQTFFLRPDIFSLTGDHGFTTTLQFANFTHHEVTPVMMTTFIMPTSCHQSALMVTIRGAESRSRNWCRRARTLPCYHTRTTLVPNFTLLHNPKSVVKTVSLSHTSTQASPKKISITAVRFILPFLKS